MKDTNDSSGTEWNFLLRSGDFYWPGVGVGFLISALLTPAIGVPLLILFDNSWALATVSMISLFIAGLLAARMAGTSEPLNGAMIVLLHFSALAIAFFIGRATEWLPEPLPGLDASDSTFFFSWPLGQLVTGTLGALLGGLGARRGRNPRTVRSSSD